MKRLPLWIIVASGIILSSCAKKMPDFVNSIPDDVVGVATLHPMKLHTKGNVNSLESMKNKVKDEIWGQIIEDPLSTGLAMNEYFYMFVRMEVGTPVIGMVGGMKDAVKFVSTLSRIEEDFSAQIMEAEGYSYMQPDEAGIIAWNDEQLIVLGAPDGDELGAEYWRSTLDVMFNPIKEESVTSLVDFRDFTGKMKDLNLWMASNELMEVLEEISDNTEADIPQLPVTLMNNYARVFVDFADGEMHITGETHFSEEVEKNIEEVLVMKPSLNSDMLKLTPGGNLLVALAGSMDMEKLRETVGKFAPSRIDSVGNRLEAATGIPAEELVIAFTGDFTIAINALEQETMIPLELFVGLGVNSDAIQDKLMESVQNMAPVEEEGDFFIINIQGNEIYSGIIGDLWVITNARGYKEAATGSGLDRSLVDSRFNDFADGSMGMYMNLDLESYPSIVKGLLEQNPERNEWVTRITEPFDYMGVSASNYENQILLKTNRPSENSLYTLLKLSESSD